MPTVCTVLVVMRAYSHSTLLVLYHWFCFFEVWAVWALDNATESLAIAPKVGVLFDAHRITGASTG